MEDLGGYLKDNKYDNPSTRRLSKMGPYSRDT